MNMSMINQELQINNVYISLQEVKNNTILITTPSKGFSSRWLQVSFHFPIDRYRELLKLQDLNIIRDLKQLGPLENNLKNYTFLVNPNFDEIYQEIIEILDNPFYAPSTRYKKFLNLINEKATLEIEIFNPLFHKFGNVSVDEANFQVKILNYVYKIGSGSRPIKFLITLIKTEGEPISYIDIYLNSGFYSKNEVMQSNRDVKDDLKHIKKNLAKELKKGLLETSPEYEAVQKLMESIVPIKGFGYKMVCF